MKSLVVLIIAASFVTSAQAAPRKFPARLEPAHLNCMSPNEHGEIYCHLEVQSKGQDGARYHCFLSEDSCYSGFLSVLSQGETCLGAVICRPIDEPEVQK